MIGLIAAFLTTAAFVPQVVKVIKTKDTKGLSLLMYIMQVTGMFLWFVHGLSINDLPLILANAVTLCLSGIILFYKIKYK